LQEDGHGIQAGYSVNEIIMLSTLQKKNKKIKKEIIMLSVLLRATSPDSWAFSSIYHQKLELFHNPGIFWSPLHVGCTLKEEAY